MGRAIARTCKRAWSGAARPAFIVALLVLVPAGVVLIHSALRATPLNVITVNTTADPGPTADCDLRDAITAANTESAVHGCAAGTGTDLINFSVNGTMTLGSELPTVLNTLTIDGTGQTLSVKGGSQQYQIIQVNGGATLNLNDLNIIDAATSGDGGAIYNSGTLAVTNSTFVACVSGSGNGGAIYSSDSLTVTNSTFSGNDADLEGGAIYSSGSLTVTNSTFSTNSVNGSGGLSIENASGTATVSNSILSAYDLNCGGTITDGGYNISYGSSGTDNSCGFSGTSVQNTNPLLVAGGLQYNGGPTDTIALQSSSPALAAIPAASCPATDQRGATRPGPGQTQCDIGAVEGVGSPVTLSTSSTAEGALTGISGSNVTLYAVGDSGYGTSAYVLGTATTNGSGQFSMTFTVPPSANPQTYITATGGNAGAGANSAIGLMAALGPVDTLSSSTDVTINELTTAASEWSLTQFLDPTGRIVGAPSSNTLGLQNAYSSFANLAAINANNLSVSGAPSSFLPGSCPGHTNCDGLERLNTLANVLAGCVESTGPTSTACAALLCDATPGDTYSAGCSPGTPSITDTLGAAYRIVVNPTSNVSTLFGLASVSTPFSPALSFAPDGWEMALDFTNTITGASFNLPYAVALDASGNVFAANLGGDSVSELTAASNYGAGATGLNFSPAGAAFDGPASIALDESGNVFVANLYGNSVSELTAPTYATTGSNVAPLNTFNHPFSIALDASSNLFVTNFYGDSVTELTQGSGYSTTLVFAPAGAALDEPAGIALDAAGDLFAANELGNSVSDLPAPNYATTGSNFAAAAASLNMPYALALDASANIFAANYGNNSVGELTAASGYASGQNFAPAGAAFNEPYAIAPDGLGNVFAANYAGNSLSELTAASSYSTGLNFAPPGAAFKHPVALALDGSGNLWIANESTSNLSELVGLGVPVVTPLQAALPSASGAPTASATPTPTATPGVTPTPTPTPTTTATTSTPTTTPAETPATTPTPTPISPTPTPTPTSIPSPTPTPTVAPGPTPTPIPITCTPDGGGYPVANCAALSVVTNSSTLAGTLMTTSGDLLYLAISEAGTLAPNTTVGSVSGCAAAWTQDAVANSQGWGSGTVFHATSNTTGACIITVTLTNPNTASGTAYDVPYGTGAIDNLATGTITPVPALNPNLDTGAALTSNGLDVLVAALGAYTSGTWNGALTDSNGAIVDDGPRDGSDFLGDQGHQLLSSTGSFDVSRTISGYAAGGAAFVAYQLNPFGSTPGPTSTSTPTPTPAPEPTPGPTPAPCNPDAGGYPVAHCAALGPISSGTTLTNSLTTTSGDLLYVAISESGTISGDTAVASVSGCAAVWTQDEVANLPGWGSGSVFHASSNTTGSCAITVTLAEPNAASATAYDVPYGTVTIDNLAMGTTSPVPATNPNLSTGAAGTSHGLDVLIAALGAYTVTGNWNGPLIDSLGTIVDDGPRDGVDFLGDQGHQLLTTTGSYDVSRTISGNAAGGAAFVAYVLASPTPSATASSIPTPTPTPGPTGVPIATPTPTRTPAPAPTSTPTPTPTAAPTPTPTPTPTPLPGTCNADSGGYPVAHCAVLGPISSGTTLTGNLTMTSGDLLYVAISEAGTISANTMVMSVSGCAASWTDDAVGNSSGWGSGTVFHATSNTTSSCAITVTLASSNAASATVYDVPFGTATVDTLAMKTTFPVPATNPNLSTGIASTSHALDVLITALGAYTTGGNWNGALLDTNGTVLDDGPHNEVDFLGDQGHQRLTTVGSYGVSRTITGTAAGGAAFVAYQLKPTPTPTPP